MKRRVHLAGASCSIVWPSALSAAGLRFGRFVNTRLKRNRMLVPLGVNDHRGVGDCVWRFPPGFGEPGVNAFGHRFSQDALGVTRHRCARQRQAKRIFCIAFPRAPRTGAADWSLRIAASASASLPC